MPEDIPFTEATSDADDVLLHVTRDGGPTSFWLSETDTLTDAELRAQLPGTRTVAADLIEGDPSWVRHASGWSRPDQGGTP